MENTKQMNKKLKQQEPTGRNSLWAAHGLKSFFHSSAFPTEKVIGYML